MKKNLSTLDRFIFVINQKPINHRPTLNQIIKFQTKKVLAKTVFPNDFAFWENKNWFKMPYYYECKINPCDRLMGSLFHWMLFKIMTKAVKSYKDKIGTKEFGKIIYE